MDSAKNSTKYSKKNEHPSSYCRKQKKEEHFQTLSIALLPKPDEGSQTLTNIVAKVLNKILANQIKNISKILYIRSTLGM